MRSKLSTTWATTAARPTASCNTRSCIHAFQQANGLDATGAVNEATYEKMLERQ